jgi:UPF0755 protein
MTQYPEPQPSMWGLARPILVIIVVVFAGVGIISAASWLGNRVGAGIEVAGSDDRGEVEPGLEVEVEIPLGASAEAIADILFQAGVIDSTSQFEAAVRALGAGSALQAGTYELITGMDQATLIDELRRGPRPAIFTVTVREGLRVPEIIDALSEASGLEASDFEEALIAGQVSTSVREMPEEISLRDWEGLLFPDTYEFSVEASAASLLQRLATTMENRMASVDWSAFEEAGFSQYQGVIIASLIESEVRVAEERPIVSSVIRNRLTDGARLDIDATILYALDSRDPSVIDVGFDSPYNTRLVPGLPPTPISAPGLASLQAAAQPDDTEFRYYVLSSLDGSHAFSVTLDEHNAAVAESRAAGIIP